MRNQIDIHQFLEQFNKEYDYLYENYAFDEFAPAHSEFVGEFVKFRGDFISSDREAAAFMFALGELLAKALEN